MWNGRWAPRGEGREVQAEGNSLDKDRAAGLQGSEPSETWEVVSKSVQLMALSTSCQPFSTCKYP